MHGAEPGTLTDRPDPPVGGSPVESVTVAVPQDRSLVALTDGQVDRPSRAGDERDRGWLVALAQDPQRAVATLDTEVLDVGGTGLADTQPVQAQQHGEGRVIPAYCSAVNRNTPSSERSRPRASDAWTWGRRTYWAGFERMRPSMCANR
jgi:hypothetical protein